MQTHVIPLHEVRQILSTIAAVLRSREVALAEYGRPVALSSPHKEAEPELWAIQVHDPEDIWAMPNKDLAEMAATAHQKLLDDIAEDAGLPPPVHRTKAVPWPFDAASHAEALRNGEGTLFKEEYVLH